MKENLRQMVVTPETGKDFRDTKVVSGMANKSAAESASNSVTQYKTSAGKKGALGGKNTNS